MRQWHCQFYCQWHCQFYAPVTLSVLCASDIVSFMRQWHCQFYVDPITLVLFEAAVIAATIKPCIVFALNVAFQRAKWYGAFTLIMARHWLCPIQPGPVDRSDARPSGVQTVASSIVRSSKTFCHGDWSWNHFSSYRWFTDDYLVLVNHLGLRLPRRSVVRLTDRLDMTIIVNWYVKPQHTQTKVPDAVATSTFAEFLFLCFWCST